MTRAAPLDERIRANVIVTEDGCWLWQRRIDRYGYGRIVLSKKKTAKAHRVSYETFIGPIPEGLVIDHLCRNRACVNPAHLEPVTVKQNIQRGETGQYRVAAVLEGCPSHHYVTSASGRTRYCPECNKRRILAYKARKRQ